MTRLISRDDEPAVRPARVPARRGRVRRDGARARRHPLRLRRVRAGRAPGEPVSSKVRWGMLIDINKCGDGCDDCVTACRERTAGAARAIRETDPQWIRKVTLRDPKTG